MWFQTDVSGALVLWEKEIKENKKSFYRRCPNLAHAPPRLELVLSIPKKNTTSTRRPSILPASHTHFQCLSVLYLCNYANAAELLFKYYWLQSSPVFLFPYVIFELPWFLHLTFQSFCDGGSCVSGPPSPRTEAIINNFTLWSEFGARRTTLMDNSEQKEILCYGCFGQILMEQTSLSLDLAFHNLPQSIPIGLICPPQNNTFNFLKGLTL